MSAALFIRADQDIQSKLTDVLNIMQTCFYFFIYGYGFFCNLLSFHSGSIRTVDQCLLGAGIM